MVSVLRVFAMLAFVLTVATSVVCIWSASLGDRPTAMQLATILSSPLMTAIAFRRATALAAGTTTREE